MKELPKYVNCKNKEIEVCDWYLHELCEETCAYAQDIKGLWVGSVCDSGLIKKLNELKENQNDN